MLENFNEEKDGWRIFVQYSFKDQRMSNTIFDYEEELDKLVRIVYFRVQMTIF